MQSLLDVMDHDDDINLPPPDEDPESLQITMKRCAEGWCHSIFICLVTVFSGGFSQEIHVVVSSRTMKPFRIRHQIIRQTFRQ